MASKTTKKTTRKKKAAPKAEAHDLPWVEICGVGILAFGLFAALSLYAFEPGDLDGPRDAIQNAGGLIGAYLAAGLAGFFGLLSHLLPLGFVYIGVQLLRHGLQLPSPRPTIGISLMAVTLLAILHVLLVDGRGLEVYRAGGYLGAVLGDVALRYAGTVGAYIVLVALLLFSLQIALGVRIGPLVDRGTLLFQRVVPGMFRWAGDLALEGSSHAGQAMKQRWSDWLDARDSEPLEGYGNPLLGSGDEGDDDGAELSSLPEVGPEVKVVAEVMKGDTNDAPPKLNPDGSEFGGRSLEDLAAAYKAKRLAGGPRIVKNRDAAGVAQAGAAATGSLGVQGGDYQLPPLSLLATPPANQAGALNEVELREAAEVLEQKLRDYGVEGEVVEIHPGPIITMFEYVPAPGVKVSKITNLSNDLAMALKATRIRIVAPIPGKAAVGIEVPNPAREIVFLRENLAHKSFSDPKINLPIALGKDTEGIPFAADMAKMPHLLVAGATGTGKSVAVNSMILSLLFSRTPDEVRLILVDPKMLEFSLYNDIPHLLLPVVTDPKKAAQALNWAVGEMTRRYKLLSKVGSRNIANYNKKVEAELKRWEKHGGMPPEYIPWEDPAPGEEDDDPKPPSKLPFIVIIIDELADLMMVAAKEVQDSIVRLAQMARAAGIHLLLATQRPSVDVITGLIKANFPSRISFQVSSKTDSRTILDTNGAEHLLGMGDMLYLPPGVAALNRLHAAFCSDEEVKIVTDFVKSQGEPQYEPTLIATVNEEGGDMGGMAPEDYDEYYDQAIAVVTESRKVSVSSIQRRFKIGYNRAARIVEVMEKEGVITTADHTGRREVLAQPLDFA